MKLYTKKKGLVLEGNDKLIKSLIRDHTDEDYFGKEKLITEKEWLKLNFKYEKLDLDYSKISQINLELLYQERINCITLTIEYVDHNKEIHYVDHDIENDNNEFLTELVLSVCSYYGGISNNVNFTKYILPYFDEKEIKKYKIRFYDVNAGIQFTLARKNYILRTGRSTDL